MKNFLFTLVLFLLPLLMLASVATTVQAQTTPNKTYMGGPLVTCGLNGPVDDTGKQACSFQEFIKLINRIINFLIYLVGPIIMTGVLLYGGILILTSAGNAENVTKAKGMIFKAITGMALAMIGWILVKFVMEKLGYRDSVFPTFY